MVTRLRDVSAGSCAECFLTDTGATLNIIGLEVAKDNGLKLTKLIKTRRIAEASGNFLDIVGECSMFIKLDIFQRKAKRMGAMVLRANVDQQILVSSSNLKQWRLIHPNFPLETVDQYISRYLKHEIKVVKDYNNVTLNGQKVKTPKIRKQPKECK